MPCILARRRPGFVSHTPKILSRILWNLFEWRWGTVFSICCFFRGKVGDLVLRRPVLLIGGPNRRPCRGLVTSRDCNAQTLTRSPHANDGLCGLVFYSTTGRPLSACYCSRAQQYSRTREQDRFQPSGEIACAPDCVGLPEEDRSGECFGPHRQLVRAGASASLADPIIGDLLTPKALLSLLNSAQVNIGRLRIQNALVPLPNGDMGSLWSVFQNAEYGFGKVNVRLPLSAAKDQYRIHLELLQWKWKLVAMDLPRNVSDQLADELIRRIGG